MSRDARQISMWIMTRKITKMLVLRYEMYMCGVCQHSCRVTVFLCCQFLRHFVALWIEFYRTRGLPVSRVACPAFRSLSAGLLIQLVTLCQHFSVLSLTAFVNIVVA